MTNFKKAFFLGLLGVFTLSSCTKEEEPQTQEFPQELLIDGTRYELGEGFILSYGTSASHQGTNLDLNVVTSGLSLVYDANGYPDSATGTGFIFYLEMYSSDSTAITAGTYTIDTTETGNLKTISAGAVFSYGTPIDTEYNFVSGNLEVVRTNGIYSFVGSFVEEGGKAVKFSYQKSLAVIDDN